MIKFEAPALGGLESETRRIGRLSCALRLLSWDQETLMPPGGAEGRARVLGEMTEVVHRLAISDELGEKILAAEAELEARPDDLGQAFVREVRRRYEKRRGIPPELAEELARTQSGAQQAWKEARSRDEFSLFAPHLEKLVALKLREVEARGGQDAPYDTLLDDYEPDCTTEILENICAEVKPRLVELVQELAPLSSEVPTHFLAGYDVERQRTFCLRVIADLGFDLDRGRVDVSAHPFCSGILPGDVRLTTRFSEEFLPQALFGLIHEAGHGLYEQGLDPEWTGTPLGDSVSMGIHESQSRMWENMIARSPEFWSHYYPELRRLFPDRLGDVSENSFVRAVNTVSPSLIRVESDEVTYSLHIMVRFEIEKALLAGEIAVRDLPGVWNEKMKEALGVEPATDAEGVLQDIHWSLGAFGYFPTYFLGNLYAAQFYETAARELDGLPAQIAGGRFGDLRSWLRDRIHRHGSRYPAEELCRRVTGRGLDPEPFIRYLGERLRGIHGA